jgi:hypothetical protein
LENEASNDDEGDETYGMEETIKSTTLDVDATDTGDTSDSKFGITPTLETLQAMTPYQKGLATRETNNKKQIS